jgi:hypothetical protein
VCGRRAGGARSKPRRLVCRLPAGRRRRGADHLISRCGDARRCALQEHDHGDAGGAKTEHSEVDHHGAPHMSDRDVEKLILVRQTGQVRPAHPEEVTASMLNDGLQSYEQAMHQVGQGLGGFLKGGVLGQGLKVIWQAS